ncbi:CaiB/BaiF CoA transferase family protein [Albidovulum sp.]|uniref:CaiB/BaiF CoA transferase family protein n=1 Tax=Albidovulum sp. TaxID=1872424 RepID=UPI00302EECB0
MADAGREGHGMTGPLSGLRIVEIAGLGPTPFTAMVLADMGAEVVRIERPGNRHLLGLSYDILNRGRGFVALDLKTDDGRGAARRLIARADGLIEGLRPGVMERLGLGPEDFPDNPRLVYGRMTGWGQTGPFAQTAGHDLNYIALSGALHAIGPAERPVPPLNLVGDFGGGAMYLAFGMVCAFLEAARSGRGQVVDAAISDGTAHLMAMIQGMTAGGAWSQAREANILDGAAPFYRCYECREGGFLAVGAIEPKFWAEFLRLAGIDAAAMPPQMDRARWPEAAARVAARIGERTRDDWAAVFTGSDACAVPVLALEEAPAHPHNAARATYVVHDGVVQPAPAPRLSRTPGRIGAGSQSKPLEIGTVLADWGA